jgi:hypothetical protein
MSEDENIRNLKKALKAGSYPQGSGNLINGSPLIMEDLAMPDGLYTEDQVDLNDPDVKLFSAKWVWDGKLIFYKQSEGKIKVYRIEESGGET